MSTLLLNVINSENTINFTLAASNIESLKQKASERFGKKVNRFARIPDGSEIHDFETLKLIYNIYVKKTKNLEMKLIALCEGEKLCPNDIKYFGCAESYKLINIIKDLKNAESVDICFLMSCTKAMEKYADEFSIKKILHQIFKKIDSPYKTNKIRCSFVGYRVYENNERDIIRLDFTENFKELEKVFESIEFEKSDGSCEDVFGGLDAVTKLNWINGSRVLLHICDTPCYGKEFHDEINDSYPNGDPTELKISDLLKTLVQLNVDYYFVETGDKTKRMIDVFKRELNLIPGHKNLTVYKLNQSSELLNTITTSVTLTISSIQKLSYTGALNKEPKPIKVNKDFDWGNLSNFKDYTVDHYLFQFNGNIEFIKKLAAQYQSRDENQDQIKSNTIDSLIEYEKCENQSLSLSIVPFSKGNLRFTYPTIFRKEKEDIKCVTKNSLYIGYDNLFAVNKTSIKSQIVAKFLAEEFCKMLEEKWNFEKTIKFLEVGLVEMKDEKQYYSIENFISGKFIKWNSNIGLVNESEYTCTLDAFAHWTHEITNGYLIVTDLQGCIVGCQYLLTDPSISCLERQFDSTDLGELGILRFFEFHRCNQICRKLKLKKHEFQKQPDRPDNANLTKINDKIQND